MILVRCRACGYATNRETAVKVGGPKDVHYLCPTCARKAARDG